MEKEDIIIKKLENGCFDVHVGNKSTGQVTFDEMLGTVAQLTMPDNRRCLQWLKTEEQHQAFKNRYKTVPVIDLEQFSHGILKGTIKTALPEPQNKEDKI